MTIDVAIAHIRNEANSMKQCAEILCCTQDFFSDIEYHEQLADWLEELKNLRAENAYLHCEMQAIGATMDMFETEIRNKAIDDFLREICKKYTEEESKGNFKQYCCSIKQELADLAQQLKEGGTNGNSTTDN